jgi:hypothetical protein
MIAPDSISAKPSSVITGIDPIGLIARNSGALRSSP